MMQHPVIVPSAVQVPVSLAHETPWSAVVDAYLAAAVDSPHTRRAYARHLETTFTWLGVISVGELTHSAPALDIALDYEGP